MYFLGLDLGQKRDHSAVAVVERIDHRRAFQGTAFQRLVVRYAERLPLGTPYPQVVERVRGIVRSQELASNCAVAVDATGVGAPVVDMLRAARLGCDLTDVRASKGRVGADGTGEHDDLVIALALACWRAKRREFCGEVGHRLPGI